jgi:alpha-glucosidase
VGLIAWYNSNGSFNDAPQTPQDRMDSTAVRRAEFARLQEMGVRGVKVDFMGGDKQSVVRLYHEILRDAADHRILVNFHGATLPRGWERTHPNLMTVEAVKGYEFITFGQPDADAAPVHGAVLPYTRNVVGPMDFTPTMLTERVGASVRRTTNGYDLAMPVVFESGIQHLGVTPEVMAGVPSYVAEYLGTVPAAWDETRYIEGLPGEHVVLARRSGATWYVGALNGRDTARMVTLELPFLDGPWEGTLITDGDGDHGFSRSTIAGGERVEMMPRGGFVVVIER